MNERKRYTTDLTDQQWAIMAALLPRQRTGRPRKHAQRERINGMLYVLRTGCAWRLLPHDLPPWESVYAYWRKLQALGVWERINDELRAWATEPSTILVDSQSVKTTEKGDLEAMMDTSASKAASGR